MKNQKIKKELMVNQKLSFEQILLVDENFKEEPRLATFFFHWLNNGMIATDAYLRMHPNVTRASAAVLGGKMLAKIDKKLVLEAYGLGVEKYLEKLKEGLEANKPVSVMVVGGKGELRDANSTSTDFVDVPDHATRLKYHDKLGKLLNIEDQPTQTPGVVQQFNISGVTSEIEKARKERGL